MTATALRSHMDIEYRRTEAEALAALIKKLGQKISGLPVTATDADWVVETTVLKALSTAVRDHAGRYQALNGLPDETGELEAVHAICYVANTLTVAGLEVIDGPERRQAIEHLVGADTTLHFLVMALLKSLEETPSLAA